MQVTFNDRSGGTLSEDPDALTEVTLTPETNPRTGTIVTDASGEASIGYTAREGGAVHTVSASITVGGYKEVLFTINGTPSSGGGGGGGDDDADDADVDTPTISSASLEQVSLVKRGMRKTLGLPQRLPV